MADGKEGTDKGFRVVDRRSSFADDAPASAPAPDAEPAAAKAEEPPAPDSAKEAGSTPGGPGLGAPGFTDLVESLQMNAMFHLGMIGMKGAERPRVNLPAAKDAIDMLAVLKDKTRGNLAAEEEEVLNEGLYVLRMSYLHALNQGAPQGGEKG